MSAIRNTVMKKEIFLFLFPAELDEDEGGPETIDKKRVFSIESDLGNWSQDESWPPDIYRMALNELKKR